MDIAAMSTIMSQARVQQQASMSVMKMAMDAGETQMNDIMQMVEQDTKRMEQSITPHLGKNIDISL